SGERWRTDSGPPHSDEVQIQGSRVVLPASHALIAPWSENIRYGMKKNGYHGGVSPQEMIVPLVVLSAAASRPAGWTEALFDVPSWWDMALQEPPVAVRPTLPWTGRGNGSASL